MEAKRKLQYEVQEISKGIFLVNEFFSTMFVICGEKRALVIDCGVGVGDFKSVIEKITKLPYDVAMTHSHVDHIGGRGQFKDIFVSEADSRYIKAVNMLQRRGFVLVNKFMGNNFSGLKFSKVHPEPNVHRIKEGDTFDLGGKTIKVYSTPGHTVGSVSFLDVEDRILFIGDVANENLLMWLPHATSIDEMMETHERILSMDCYDTVWSSHHTVPTTRDDIKKYLAGAKQIASRKKNSLFPIVKTNNYDGAILIYRTSFIHKKDKAGKR